MSPDTGQRFRFAAAPNQPVVKVSAAFEQRCIPPDGVVRRLRMPNMRPPHALSGERLAALGATRDSTTGCNVSGDGRRSPLLRTGTLRVVRAFHIFAEST